MGQLLVKKQIKKAIVRTCGKNINQIIVNDISKYNVISFDVFDTLIQRKCGNPEMIFRIVDENATQLYHDLKKHDFYRLRMECERELRRKSKKEIDYSEVYYLISEFLGKERSIKLKQLEIETEYNQCSPNKELVDIYHKIVSQGKRVFIVSDMYLSSDMISRMLEKCGIVGYEKLYVSSESGLTKRSGNLFRKIIKDNKLNVHENKEMIHIGDNPIGDYIIPKKVGIDAILYRRQQKDY